jgi:hypothetical protein
MKVLYVKVCKGKFLLQKFFLFFFSTNCFLSRFLCDCAINEATRPAVREAVYQYQAATNALIDSGIYDDKDDFTVVRQPFMEHMTVPLTVIFIFLINNRSASFCYSPMALLIFHILHLIVFISVEKVMKQLLLNFGIT